MDLENLRNFYLLNTRVSRIIFSECILYLYMRESACMVYIIHVYLRSIFYDFIQERIGDRRIIQFIVAPPPEAVQVDKNVLPEPPLILERYSRSSYDHLERFRLVTLYYNIFLKNAL